MVYAESGLFRIGRLNILSPVTNEKYQAGRINQIRWEGISPVKIEFWNGSSWSVLTSSASGGSYDWNISAGQASGTNYKIRLSDPLNSSFNVESGLFTINKIAITR